VHIHDLTGISQFLPEKNVVLIFSFFLKTNKLINLIYLLDKLGYIKYNAGYILVWYYLFIYYIIYMY
jgi:hypothetical protein